MRVCACMYVCVYVCVWVRVRVHACVCLCILEQHTLDFARQARLSQHVLHAEVEQKSQR